MSARAIAFKILILWDQKPNFLDSIIDNEFSKGSIDHRDKRFVFELVYGIMRQALSLDYIITQFISNPKLLENTYLKRILEIGTYQILFMDRVPDYASVNESVKIAQKYKKTYKYTGLINAVLRAIIKNKNQLKRFDSNMELVKRLSIEYSHPEWLVKRWLYRFGLEKTQKLLLFNNQRPDIFIRRKLKGISKQQFELETKKYCENFGGYYSLYYKLKKNVQPESLIPFKEGKCIVQSPSSGWIVALLDVKSGDKVVDVCSAPGGKTSLIAELAGEYGKVIACDLQEKRLKTAIESFDRMRLTTISPLVCNGFYLPFKCYFNKIILDAPCSGTGVIHRHPEARWIKKEEDIIQLSQNQKKLIESVSKFVSVGGALIYSTCSIEKEENEDVIEWFLERNKNFILEKNITNIPEKYLDIKGCVNIAPYEHNLDGMFGAKLKRIK
jgi:16S rRNA (cytosine967-C5)-methyltransferase